VADLLGALLMTCAQCQQFSRATCRLDALLLGQAVQGKRLVHAALRQWKLEGELYILSYSCCGMLLCCVRAGVWS
jgi:hypothetical protein